MNLLCIKMNAFYWWSFYIHPIFIPTAVHNFYVLLFLTSTELENEPNISKAAIFFDVRYYPCFQFLAAVEYNLRTIGQNPLLAVQIIPWKA